MQTSSQSKRTAEVTDFFTRKPIEIAAPPSNGRSDYLIALSNPSNKARMLAQTEDFMGMCEDILWGSESKQHLGQLLEGLVDHFLPRNRFELELLRNIAEIQWAIRRKAVVAKVVFDTGEQTAGKSRLPKRTEEATASLREGDALLGHLEAAIRMYNSAKRVTK